MHKSKLIIIVKNILFYLLLQRIIGIIEIQQIFALRLLEWRIYANKTAKQGNGTLPKTQP